MAKRINPISRLIYHTTWGQEYMFLLPVLVYLFHATNGAVSGPLVQTKVGLIRGLRDEENSYSLFMGIPYATVNENNPFGSANPQPNFEDVFEAYDDSAICPQVEEFNQTITGSLDCLHINVYVPDSAKSPNKLPVLVWIYGGSFSVGFAGRYLYGPKYLIRHDIILVTFNYRVGPYGFMCLDTPEVPGNTGMKDQKLALKWIKDNIEAFAGDPDKITIYGISAGGMIVNFHYMYGDNSLFDKMIMHSGTALTPGIIGTPDRTAALKLAKDLGLDTDDNNEALKFLAKVDPLQVIASNQALGLTYGLCVEKEFDGVERFISEHPLNVIGPDASNKSVLVAYNHDELLIVYTNVPADSFPKLSGIFENKLRNNFNFNSTELKKMEEIVRQFYIGDRDFTDNVRWDIGKYTSDLQFIYPTVRTIRRFIKYGSQNVYHLIFSYNGQRNFSKTKYNVTHMDLVVHADDLGYLFDVSYMGTPSESDQLTIDRMTTLWANFVKYGNPTPQPTDLLPLMWEPAIKDTIPYLELDYKVHVGKQYYRDRVAFWDHFYEMNCDKQNGYTHVLDRL